MSGLRDADALKVRGLYATFALCLMVGFCVSSVPSRSSSAFSAACDPAPASALPPPPDVDLLGGQPPMRTIGTVADFDAAISLERCVLFVDADWSMTAVLARQVVYPFVRSWLARQEYTDELFFRIDATVQRGRVADRFLSTLNKNGTWTSGAGPLLFLRRGQVIETVDSAVLATPSTLVEKTRRILEQ